MSTSLLNRIRSCLTIFAIVVQGAAFNSTVELDVPFYPTYFKERGVPHVFVGGYGMAPILGVAAACFIDLTVHLKRLCKKTINVQFILIILSLFVTGLQGMTDLIPTAQASTIQIPLLITLRVILGAIVSWGFKAQIDCCRHFFSSKYEFVMGFAMAGPYIGSSYSAVLGGTLYSKFGFIAPFGALLGLNLVILAINIVVLPFQVPEDLQEEKTSQFDMEHFDRETKISWETGLPMTCNFIEMTLWGAISCNLVIYLKEESGLDESAGSTCLLVGCLVKIGACVAVGAIVKRKILSTAQMMLILSVVAAAGLLLLYPDPRITFLHSNLQVVAFFGTALVGTTQAATDEAAILSADALNPSPRAKSLAIRLTLVVGDTGMYLGHMVGAMIRKHVRYHVGGYMLCGVSGVSVLAAALLHARTRAGSANDASRRSDG